MTNQSNKKWCHCGRGNEAMPNGWQTLNFVVYQMKMKAWGRAVSVSKGAIISINATSVVDQLAFRLR